MGQAIANPGSAHVEITGGESSRAGTVSGGTLEEEVARKALGNTREGAVIEEYSTRKDDGGEDGGRRDAEVSPRTRELGRARPVQAHWLWLIGQDFR